MKHVSLRISDGGFYMYTLIFDLNVLISHLVSLVQCTIIWEEAHACLGWENSILQQVYMLLSLSFPTKRGERC